MKEVELNNKWSQKTRDYVSKKLDSIKDVCAKVAEKKQLDLVLIDSADAPSVEYGGVDISGDILGELPGMAGAGQVDSSSGSGETVEGSK